MIGLNIKVVSQDQDLKKEDNVTVAEVVEIYILRCQWWKFKTLEIWVVRSENGNRDVRIRGVERKKKILRDV